MGRRTRSTLSLSEELLRPAPTDPSTVYSEITLRKETSKAHYDKQAQPPLMPLPLGSHACHVVSNPSPQSYNIDTGNHILRRNWAQLRPAEPPRNILPRSPPLPSTQFSLPATPSNSSSTSPHKPQRPTIAADRVQPHASTPSLMEHFSSCSY